MSVRVNTLANFGGRVWTVALGALLIPVYVRLLGIEAYALVGISATIQVIFSLLDLGMGAAFSREISRLEAFEETKREERDLLATFDVLYFALAVLVLLLIQFVAPFVATKWVSAQALDRRSILVALRLIGVSVAFQLPTSFYLGGLIGLERQVIYNMVNVASATLRGLGAVAALLFIGPTVGVFFGWQVVISVATAIAVAILLHRIVDGRSGRGVARFALIRRVWRYAAGWTTNSVGTNLASQVDKVVLSRILPLAQFGYYTLASTAATLLWNLVVPVSAAIFPRFNRSIAAGDDDALRRQYFGANQLLAAVLVPVSALILFFPREVLMLWTRDAVVTAATQPVIVWFAAGMMVAGLSNVALHLALGYGWFRLPIAITILAALFVVPVMIIAARRYGAAGGAIAWAMQVGSVAALVPLLHRRHLRGEGKRWFIYVIALPALAAGAVCSLAWLVRPHSDDFAVLAAFLFATWAATSLAVVAVEPLIRSELIRVVRRAGAAARWAKGDLR